MGFRPLDPKSSASAVPPLSPTLAIIMIIIPRGGLDKRGKKCILRITTGFGKLEVGETGRGGIPQAAGILQRKVC